MGRNNHHAGMHMIWYRNYIYGNDDYGYDRYISMIAEEKMKKPVAESIRQSSNEINTPITTEKNKSDRKKTNYMKSDNTKKTVQNKKKPKYRSNGSQRKEYGTEMLLDVHHFLLTFKIMRNVMVYAIKHKLNIGKILSECENIMKRDKRTNPDEESEWAYFPKSQNVLVFFSLLAEKMDCNITDFFITDDDACKRFVYRLLDEEMVGDPLYWELDIDEFTQNAELTFENFDVHYSMADELVSLPMDQMNLTISRTKYSDDETVYEISFGSLSLSKYFSNNYVQKGAYLLEEQDGKLKDFADNMIKKLIDKE